MIREAWAVTDRMTNVISREERRMREIEDLHDLLVATVRSVETLQLRLVDQRSRIEITASAVLRSWRRMIEEVGNHLDGDDREVLAGILIDLRSQLDEARE